MTAKYLFLDLETTGLDETRDVILEVAVVAVNKDLALGDSFQSFVHADEKYLRFMDEWCKKTHSESGLLAGVRGQDSHFVSHVEDKLLEFIDDSFGEHVNKIVLAGNSIHFDRKFIKMHMPKLEKRLHYKMLDVSSFGIVVEDMFEMRKKKINAHRAMPDVLESIDELKDYVQFLTTIGKELK